MGAAAPLALKGGMALGLSALGKKLSSGAGKMSPYQLTAFTGAQNAATGLARSGADATEAGTRDLNAVTDYYTRLAKGDRTELTSALTPEIKGISDLYRGAGKNLDRVGVRGAARDEAEAEIGREKASRIGSLLTSARAEGTAGLDNLGRFKTATGSADRIAAGNLNLGTYAGATNQAQFGAAQANQTGMDVGKLIFSLLKPGGDSGGAGKAAAGSGG